MTSLPIKLSIGYIPVVKVGDVVTVGTVLAKKEEKHEIELDLANIFGVNPRKVKKFVKKNPGDRVVDGEVIASKTKLFGMQEEKVLSHIVGTISGFDRNSGKLSIVQHGEGDDVSSDLELLSPIDGVVELCDNDLSLPDSKAQIVIKTEKNVIAGNQGTGGNAEADVYVLDVGGNYKKLYEGIAQVQHMDTSMIEKILVAGVLDRDVIVKAIGMGVKGVIGAKIRDEDIAYIKERNLGVPVICVDDEQFMRIVKWNGKKLFINGDNSTVLFLGK